MTTGGDSVSGADHEHDATAGGDSVPPGDDSEWETAFEGPELAYPDMPTWMGNWLSLMVRRQLGGSLTWCAQWWRHAEAISRLDALWRAWETLRQEATLGMSVWWRDHADHHLAVLMSRDSGPFAGCTPDRHVELEPMPSAEASPGWWGAPGEAPGTGGPE